MSPSLLELLGVSCSVDAENTIFDGVNLRVDEGDIVVLKGKSGTGKSTLLKCIAHLTTYEGLILYQGRTPQQVGIPFFRTKVLYVPQRPSLLPGSPVDFLKSILTLSAHLAHLKNAHTVFQDVYARAAGISDKWGVAAELWDRSWNNLSGGEAQRLLLAVAISLDTAQVLLLDEPTSALDPDTALAVENFLVGEVNSGQSTLRALVWITHSSEQGQRIGTRFVHFSGGTCSEHSPTLAISA